MIVTMMLHNKIKMILKRSVLNEMFLHLHKVINNMIKCHKRDQVKIIVKEITLVKNKMMILKIFVKEINQMIIFLKEREEKVTIH